MSMLLMVALMASAGGVTFVQVAPSSRDTCTRPSSLPAHRTPRSVGDSSKANTVPKTSTPVPSDVMGPPANPWCSGSSVVRSGLITSQD
jgi:hypothetical protein